MNVEHKEYASKGVAGTGLGLGIAGTTLGLLGGGLGNILAGGWGCNAAHFCSSEKDAKIAELTAELNTDRKLVAVWDNLNTKREDTDKDVATLKAKVDYLQYIIGSITKVVVPNSAVCPGWGTSTTTPAAAA